MPPSDRTDLVFVLHFHQPYGNLDRVFADATERCYAPTLARLLSHPHARAGLHVSGPLLKWLADRRPDVVGSIAALVGRGQCEVLGGGVEEPMLAALPDRDATGQLVEMADLCDRLFGARPRGMWLAERVWEPDLPRILRAAGVEYVLLDDSHLVAAGCEHPVRGHWVTEKAGDAVAVFPIDRGLRYRIPFADHDDLFAYLDEARGTTITYGDDAEKFGLWLGTAKRVWKDGWLDRFFAGAAERADRLAFRLPSEALRDAPAGFVYVPTISYAEMGAWALPAEAGERLADLDRALRDAGLEDRAAPFVRGGIWQSFLAKYPEARRLHRKMLLVSRKVEEARLRADPAWRAARDDLYRGQCNCAYWHGLFGGLYLGHLRGALASALLRAERAVDPAAPARATVADHDGDLRDEVLLESSFANAYLSPDRGGRVFEIDLRGAAFHLSDALGRRREAYHRDVARARVVDEDALDGVSAHDVVRATEEGLVDRLRYDAYERAALVDHVLPADATLAALEGPRYAPLADVARAPWEIVETAGGATARAVLRTARDGVAVRRSMALAPEQGAPERGAIEIAWDVSADGPVRGATFATEMAMTFMAAAAEGARGVETVGRPDVDDAPGATIACADVREVRAWLAAGDGHGDVRLAIEADPPAEVWRFPLETVSQSERGFERTYQGTVIAFAWRGAVGEGRTMRPRLTVRIG